MRCICEYGIAVEEVQNESVERCGRETKAIQHSLHLGYVRDDYHNF